MSLKDEALEKVRDYVRAARIYGVPEQDIRQAVEAALAEPLPPERNMEYHWASGR